MKTHFLTGCFLVIALSVFGQAGKLKKADQYYTKLSYSYAAALYEELLGSEVDSPQLKEKLAMSYYKMGDTKNAEKYFSQMIGTAAAGSEDYFNYAQALKQNGKYAESDQWMEKFHNNALADARGLSFVKDPSYVATIEKQGNRFTINNLAVNTPSADFGGYPSPDNSDAYFVSSRRKRVFIHNEWAWTGKRFLDLYKAAIAGDQQLNNAKAIARKVNTRYHEGPLCFSADGKTVYYTRNNISRGSKKRDQQGIQNLKLYRAVIDAEGSWTKEEVLPFSSKDYSVGHPTISADGKTLYFASDMPGGFGGADLYRAEIKADGTFGAATNMGKQFNTEGQELFPWISQEGYLFFSSNGHIGLGGLDVFVMLPGKNGGFSKLINAGKPVNSQNDDFAFTMNKDNRSGYFSSNREGGKGDDDIYSYQLLQPFEQTLMLEGIISDLRTKELLPGSTVYLKDKAGNVLQTTTADAKGGYRFELEPDKDYVVAAAKDTYFDNQGTISTVNLAPDVNVISKNVDLEKDPGLALYCLVTDKKSGAALAGVRLKIVDQMTGNEFLEVETPATGDALKGISDKKINDQLLYTITLEKEGYLAKTVTFKYQVVEPGVIKVSEALDLSMSKLDVGTDLATLIDIRPIYFDYGKFAIRKDAATELDKIVKVMNDYPTLEIELGSHTDCRGTIASNEKLSDNRAKASAAYVRSRISNPNRIYGKGYGESKLKNGCACEGALKSTCSEAEHQENRRTEFVIIKM